MSVNNSAGGNYSIYSTESDTDILIGGLKKRSNQLLFE